MSFLSIEQLRLPMEDTVFTKRAREVESLVNTPDQVAIGIEILNGECERARNGARAGRLVEFHIERHRVSSAEPVGTRHIASPSARSRATPCPLREVADLILKLVGGQLSVVKNVLQARRGVG